MYRALQNLSVTSAWEQLRMQAVIPETPLREYCRVRESDDDQRDKVDQGRILKTARQENSIFSSIEWNAGDGRVQGTRRKQWAKLSPAQWA
jgi:hypothetical protein